MPDFLEAALRHSAKKHGFAGEHEDRYVYGAMNHINAMHGNKITEHGEEMERKHAAKIKSSNLSGPRKIRVKRKRDW